MRYRNPRLTLTLTLTLTVFGPHDILMSVTSSVIRRRLQFVNVIQLLQVIAWSTEHSDESK